MRYPRSGPCVPSLRMKIAQLPNELVIFICFVDGCFAGGTHRCHSGRGTVLSSAAPVLNALQRLRGGQEGKKHGRLEKGAREIRSSQLIVLGNTRQSAL